MSIHLIKIIRTIFDISKVNKTFIDNRYRAYSLKVGNRPISWSGAPLPRSSREKKRVATVEIFTAGIL